MTHWRSGQIAAPYQIEAEKASPSGRDARLTLALVGAGCRPCAGYVSELSLARNRAPRIVNSYGARSDFS